MDSKGSWRDNVFVERLWRSVKHEEVYFHAYESVSAVKAEPPFTRLNLIGNTNGNACLNHPEI
jgi:hypothetical protein